MTKDIHETNIIHIVTYSLHYTADSGCSQLKMIVFVIGFVIKIHKLIGKP